MLLRTFILGISLVFLSSCSNKNHTIIGHADDTQIQVCFTPGEDCTHLLIEHIDAAQTSIEIQGYSFTSYKIAKALVRAAKRGVQVQIILDSSQFDPASHSVVPYLERAGLPLYDDYLVKIAHNKVMIFDNASVMTGSFNFTYSAQNNNAENMIIIENMDLANRYLTHWESRKNVSKKILGSP
jgi:phospholipase D